MAKGSFIFLGTADEIVDPDQLEREVRDEPVEADVEQFTCPRCAGHMNYAADGRALICEFCMYRQDVGADGRPQAEGRFGQGAFEQEFTLAMATTQGHLQPMQVRSFFCHRCAVEFILAPETISLTCPYCDAVYVTETAEKQGPGAAAERRGVPLPIPDNQVPGSVRTANFPKPTRDYP